MQMYSNEVRNQLHGITWPKGLIIEVVEYQYYLAFRFYRDNFEKFNGETKYYIAMRIKELMESVRKQGIPCYMEVEEGDGQLAR